MPAAHPISTLRFLFYSRLLFRTCEVVCNHAARLAERNGSLKAPAAQAALEELNAQRIAFQGELHRIGSSHIDVCAECKGKCCGGARERDAFTDRVLQDPETIHRAARRREGQLAAYKATADSEGAVCLLEAESVAGYCPELTCQGCRIPYELRPVQCAAYFCSAAVAKLSHEERRAGIAALKGLMGMQVRTVLLALKSRSMRR